MGSALEMHDYAKHAHAKEHFLALLRSQRQQQQEQQQQQQVMCAQRSKHHLFNLVQACKTKKSPHVQCMEGFRSSFEAVLEQFCSSFALEQNSEAAHAMAGQGVRVT